MSAITSGANSVTGPNQQPYRNGFSQTLDAFNSIGNALNAGNLSSAQSALAAFEQDTQGSSQSSSNNPFGSNTKANSDFQNLTGALQSGDLSGAQTAFANLQKDLQANGTGASRRFHNHGSRGAAANEPSGSGGPETAPTLISSSSSASPILNVVG
jgi:hypothetical protein